MVEGSIQWASSTTTSTGLCRCTAEISRDRAAKTTRRTCSGSAGPAFHAGSAERPSSMASGSTTSALSKSSRRESAGGARAARHVTFAAKTQRPMQLWITAKRAGLMLWRTIKDNLGVRRFAKLHAKRLQQAGFADAGFSLQQHGLALAFPSRSPPLVRKPSSVPRPTSGVKNCPLLASKRLGAALGRSTDRLQSAS